MATSVTADQLELIKDDPRKEASDLGPLEMIRKVKEAREEHGELISHPMACEILGISSGTLSTYLSRGKLTRIDIGPMKLLSGREIEAFYNERKSGVKYPSGRGHKRPTLAEVAKLQHDMK